MAQTIGPHSHRIEDLLENPVAAYPEFFIPKRDVCPEISVHISLGRDFGETLMRAPKRIDVLGRRLLDNCNRNLSVEDRTQLIDFPDVLEVDLSYTRPPARRPVD